jgi:hypothetical protein
MTLWAVREIKRAKNWQISMKAPVDLQMTVQSRTSQAGCRICRELQRLVCAEQIATSPWTPRAASNQRRRFHAHRPAAVSLVVFERIEGLT